MRWLYLIGLLKSFATAQIDGGECTYAVELVYLQDASTSFDPWIEHMGQEVKSMMETFHSTYKEFKMGVAAFVDKPIPTLGIGAYGGKSEWVEDYCYKRFHPLTDNPEDLETALDDMYGDMGSGGDWPEAPLDGLAYAAGDADLGWTTDRYSEAGRPIVRVVLLVTDDVGHEPGAAANAIHQSWEYPRTWENETYSIGGFGATWYFAASGAFDTGSDEAKDEYMAMAALFHKYDTGTITDDEAATLKGYVDKFGPYPWPTLLENPNDGADPSVCGVTEYISPPALGRLLKQKEVVPVFVSVANARHGPEMDAVCKEYNVPADAACLQKYYEDMLGKMQSRGVSVVMGWADLKETIVNAVGSVTDMLCKGPPSTSTELVTTVPVAATTVIESTLEPPPPATEEVIPTTEAVIPTDAVIPTTEAVIPTDAVIPTTEAVIPTDAVIPTTEAVIATTEAVIPTTEAVIPTTEAVIPTTEKVIPTTEKVIPTTEKVIPTTEQVIPTTPAPPRTTGGVVVVPPETGGGGSNIGTIAGATGGGVAGLAALAGVLYKKFGAGLFRKDSSTPLEMEEQVEVPETPVERETMEEVTMDMFH